MSSEPSNPVPASGSPSANNLIIPARYATGLGLGAPFERSVQQFDYEMPRLDQDGLCSVNLRRPEFSMTFSNPDEGTEEEIAFDGWFVLSKGLSFILHNNGGLMKVSYSKLPEEDRDWSDVLVSGGGFNFDGHLRITTKKIAGNRLSAYGWLARDCWLDLTLYQGDNEKEALVDLSGGKYER